MSHSRLLPLVVSLVSLLGVVAAVRMSVADEEPEKRSVRERLAGEVTVEFERVPLYEALDRIGNLAGVSIVLDGDGLKRAGYTRNMPQTLRLDKVTAARALDRVVDQYRGMQLVVDEKQGVVVVTTTENPAKFAPPAPQEVAASEPTDWADLVTEEQFDAEVEAIRNRLTAALATRAAYTKARLAVVRDAGTLIVLAELAAEYESLGLHHSAGRLHAIGTALHRAASTTGTTGLPAAGASRDDLESLLTDPLTESRPVRFAASPLPFTMKRFDGFHAALRGALDDPGGVERERGDLVRDAALVSALAKRISVRKEAREEAEFGTHARELSAAARELREALDEQADVAVIRARFEATTQRCTACHANFR